MINLIIRSLGTPKVCDCGVSFDAYCIAKASGKELVSVIHPDVRSYVDSLKLLYHGRKYGFKYPLYMLTLKFTFSNLVEIGKIINDPSINRLLHNFLNLLYFPS